MVGRVGLHPGVWALVEQHHLGSLHRHGNDQRKPVVVVTHTEREPTDQLGQTIPVRYRSEMFEVLKQLVLFHMLAPLARASIIAPNTEMETSECLFSKEN